ncbi:hypothetical protein [Streptomyces rimosus]|uniref:hypothetical protein n=1 Tax=Streptomyces rimosus TaxID=1927 RepID=UPI00378E81E0
MACGGAAEGVIYSDDHGTGRVPADWAFVELWIGGAGMARGYRAVPEPSPQRFVRHGGERWYPANARAAGG